MEATFTMDIVRMRQLLSFEPGYKKDASSVSDRELLNDFTGTFLARYGMKLVAKPEMTEAEASVKTEVAVPVTKAETLHPVHAPEMPDKEMETAAVPAKTPEQDKDPVEDIHTITENITDLEQHGRLKVKIGSSDMKLTVEYPASLMELQLTEEEYDKYYDVKKERRRALIGTIDINDSTAVALCQILKMIRQRAVQAGNTAAVSKIDRFFQYIMKYTEEPV